MAGQEDISSDLRLKIFRRQYFQMLDLQHIIWPPAECLRKYKVQQWIFSQMFDLDSVSYPPPERYRLRILKPLLAQIEDSIVDPEEDVRRLLASQSFGQRCIVCILLFVRSLIVIDTYIGNIR